MTDITRRLPEELLASCLRFIEFRDLIAASHVSSFWRSSALAFPDLWSHISIHGSFWTSPDALNTAIARAGQHPVEFEYSGAGQLTVAMAEAISAHLPRFISLTWTYSVVGVDLIRPAPLLCLVSFNYPRFRVSPDFLGGAAGTLRTLRVGEAIFPRVCPALQTVTCLHATYPSSPDSGAGFQYIFHLCPRLETLCLYELVGTAGMELPAGLRTATWCNLMELYTAWALESVTDVQLCMPIYVEVDLGLFLSGAFYITVTIERPAGAARIVAQLPGGRQRIFVSDALDSVWEPGAVLAEMLRAPQVRRLAIPLTVLRCAAPRQPWPRLEHLSVDVYETHMFSADLTRRGEAHPLGCLRAFPALATLELHIARSSEAGPLTRHDAKTVKRGLVALRDCMPREVWVHGFPADVARKMPVLHKAAPRVVLHYVEP